ncbi:hypothetical protein CON21_26280 [Bacillus thuringiensis]|uniref:DUF4365 domain-containing protein n=1 Tax=Bacillus thuringiensis TaxID=1428 RepID=UPI000BEDC065|nr:DUF4365 domain-containing protein [Bacillus thuringiensis]PEE97788.1 hypothetical protein CON21_26280 [Bacillus thuringiensis]
MGVNLVENAVLSELGWLFAHNTLENDYGIDAYIERREMYKEGDKEKIAIFGQIIALQIKSTDDEERNDGYFRVDFNEAQKNYWNKHTLPILIIIVNRENKECYWQEFKEELVKKNEKTRVESSNKEYYIDIPIGQKLDKEHKHQITIIAATGKQNKLKTYLSQLDLMEMVAGEQYKLKAVFNNKTTDFNSRYLGRIVDLDGIPKESEYMTESIKKAYIVPFINDDYRYDETLDPKIALEKYFDWAIVKSRGKEGEYYLGIKACYKDMVSTLKVIEKIVQ